MLVLGVDGGGTKTLAVVADRAGAVVALASGLDTNPLDQPRWREHLTETVAAALAGIDADRLVGAAFGLPVHREVTLIADQQTALARAILPAATVRNDVHTAHEAAFAGQAGVLLLAGTGSMCWAADAQGRTLRVGGWGGGFGDEGSAHWIGHTALSRTSQILDGRAEGEAFATAILAAIDVDRADAQNAMLQWYYQNPSRRPATAALAAVVDRLAADGDAMAGEVLDRAADALALHVATARRKLGLLHPDWCFVGGVSRSPAMQARLAHRLGGASSAPLLPPVGGAAWRAAHDAGWAPDDIWIARLSAEISQRLEPQ